MASALQPSTFTLEWQITWTIAFPTLVPLYWFTDEDDSLDQVWSLLAWRSLQSGHTRVLKNQETAVKATKTHHKSLEKTLSSRESSELTTQEEWGLNMRWRDSVGFGEISPSSVIAVIHWIKHRMPHKHRDMACIVDLGSGNANVLLAASITHSFVKAIGMEILPSLHAQAIRNCQHWEVVDTSTRKIELDLRCADFTIEKDWIGQADLVFIHGTVFEDLLFEEINHLCQQCRTGTVFCLISRSLDENELIRTMVEFQLEMSWGTATVFLQEKSGE